MKRQSVIVWITAILLVILSTNLFFAANVTLRFSWWGGDARHQATLAAIDAYMKLNPNVTIKAEYSGAEGYLEKKKIELASGTAPDVMQIDQTWLAELTSKGDFFVDLSKQSAVDTTPFEPGFLKEFCVYGGKLVGLPTGVNAQVMLVNKTAADKMGVNISKLSDWDTMLDEGYKLHTANKDYYLLNYDTVSFSGEILMAIVKQMNGKLMFNPDYTINFGKPELVRAHKWVADAIKTGTIQPAGDAALYSMKLEQNPKWINQQIICLVDWASNYKRYLLKDVQFALVLPPILKNAKTGASQMRPSQELTVNAKSANIAEAAKFINWFLNDKDAAVILGDVRSVPASATARDAAAAAGKIDKMTSDAVGAATKSRRPIEPAPGLDRRIQDMSADIMVKVCFGQLTPDKAADEYLKQTQQILSEIKPK